MGRHQTARDLIPNFAGVMQQEDIWDLKPRFCWLESSHPHQLPVAKCFNAAVCKTVIHGLKSHPEVQSLR